MDWYTGFGKKLSDNDIDFLADTIKMSIHTSSYSYAAGIGTGVYFDSATNEVTGTNYTAGGATLASKTTSAADPCVWDCDDITIAQSGAGFSNGRNLIFYKDTGVAATSPLICRFGASADFGNVSGTLTIQIAATGLIRVDLQ